MHGGVIAYPVMPAYGSLALEDNLEVREAVLDRFSISPSAPVLYISHPNKQTHSLQRVLLGDDLVISPTCDVRIRRFDFGKDQL